ncbi:unknown [Coraliomargarita sp. CAG:312]|nr:unknown [Coraliomargarita sp. CAG:312]
MRFCNAIMGCWEKGFIPMYSESDITASAFDATGFPSTKCSFTSFPTSLGLTREYSTEGSPALRTSTKGSA